MDSAFEIRVYSKSMQRLGWITDPVSLTFNPKKNAAGTFTITLDSDHEMIPDLMTEGSRIWVDFRGEQWSGMVGPVEGKRDSDDRGSVTFTAVDDIVILNEMLGYPQPGSAVTSQGTKTDTRSGKAETVLKGFVSANAGRFPYLSVAADQGRGATIGPLSSRMAKLGELLLPELDSVRVTVVQRDVGGVQKLVLDVVTPEAWGPVLYDADGAIDSWTYSRTPMTATHSVVMGAGEGTDREFRQVSDATASALWNRVIETTTDTRDLQLDTTTTDLNTQAKVDAAMDARGKTDLAEQAAKSGLSVVLSETDDFFYGVGGVTIGTAVQMAVGNVPQIADTISEAQITWTADEGLVVKPIVGERSDDTSSALWGQIQRLSGQLNRMQRGQ